MEQNNSNKVYTRTQWPCSIQTQQQKRTTTQTIGSIEPDSNPLQRIQDVEADFQIWDMEENYTGKHNIKAKKIHPK